MRNRFQSLYVVQFALLMILASPRLQARGDSPNESPSELDRLRQAYTLAPDDLGLQAQFTEHLITAWQKTRGTKKDMVLLEEALHHAEALMLLDPGWPERAIQARRRVLPQITNITERRRIWREIGTFYFIQDKRRKAGKAYEKGFDPELVDEAQHCGGCGASANQEEVETLLEEARQLEKELRLLEENHGGGPDPERRLYELPLSQPPVRKFHLRELPLEEKVEHAGHQQNHCPTHPSVLG